MKTIFVPIDFSPVSVNALHFAIALAKEMHAKVIVFNSYSISNTSGIFTMKNDAVAEKNSVEVSEHLALINKEIAPFVTDTYTKDNIPLQIVSIVKGGDVISSIIAEANHHKADYIIMGTKGETGLKTKVWGSVTSNVVHATNIPVWVIPEDARFEGIDQILYASDLNYEDKLNLDHLLKLGKHFNALTTCLHINVDYLNLNTEEFVFERLEKKYQSEKVDFKFKEGINVTEELNNYIEEYLVKLLAVLPKEKSFLQKVFNKSISHSLTLHTHVPLLIFHDINNKNKIS